MTTERTEELKQCPFCGCGHVWLADNTGPKLCTNAHAFVRCTGCHTDGPEAETAAGAITAWNTRSLTPQAGEGAVERVKLALKKPGQFLDFTGDHDDWKARAVLAAIPPAGRVEELERALRRIVSLDDGARRSRTMANEARAALGSHNG